MVRYSNHLDEIDEKIIEILKKNARTPYTKIGEVIGLSEAAVRKRIKKLEKTGVIKKYTIEIEYKILGYKMAWIGVDITPESLLNVLDKIKKTKCVKNVYASFGDHDIMIEFLFKAQEELNNFIKKLEKIKGIVRICPAILIEKIFKK